MQSLNSLILHVLNTPCNDALFKRHFIDQALCNRWYVANKLTHPPTTTQQCRILPVCQAFRLIHSLQHLLAEYAAFIGMWGWVGGGGDVR